MIKEPSPAIRAASTGSPPVRLAEAAPVKAFVSAVPVAPVAPAAAVNFPASGPNIAEASRGAAIAVSLSAPLTSGGLMTVP